MQHGQRPPKPDGRAWWIAAAICQALNVLVFSGAVWACVHWLVRSDSEQFYNTHRNADPDGMILLQFFMLGVTAVAACAVAYAMVGTCLTVTKYQAGPIMLLASFPVTGIAGLLALAELCRGRAALEERLFFGLCVLVVSGVCISWMALTMRQRPRHRVQAIPARPAPYAGGSPYVRPPGT